MQNATDKISGIYKGLKILDSIKFNKKFKVYGSDEFETHFFAKLQLYGQNLNLKKERNFCFYI